MTNKPVAMCPNYFTTLMAMVLIFQLALITPAYGQNNDKASELPTALIEQIKPAANNPEQLGQLFKQCQSSACSDYTFKHWQKAQWQLAQQSQKRSDYKYYLLLFPGGDKVKQAKEAIDKLDWQACLSGKNKSPCQQYLSQHKYGKQRKAAKERITEFNFEAAKKNNTVSAYEQFLRDNRNHEAAEAALRQLRYNKALEHNDLASWRSFYDLSKRPSYQTRKWQKKTKAVYQQMIDNATGEVERLLYEQIVKQTTLSEARDYLKRFPSGVHKQQVIILMEPLFFQETIKQNKVANYQAYLKQYPEGYNSVAVKTKLDTSLWQQSKNKNTRYSYQNYLKAFPQGKFASKASEKISWMKSNPAIAKISHPKEIKGIGSNPRFSWVTKFSESSGIVGYNITGTGWTYNSKGHKYGPNGYRSNRGKITVKAGGKASESHWVRGKTFCGGKVVYTWQGQDDNGHTIKIVETIKLICNQQKT